MSKIDIFIAIVCAVMFFGGLYLNILSRKLADQYAESHKVQTPSPKGPSQKVNNAKK